MKKSFLLLIFLITSSNTFPMCNTCKILDLVTKDFTVSEKEESENQSSFADSSIMVSNQDTDNAHNRRSFDEVFDDYDPCKFVLRAGINSLAWLIGNIKDLYRTAVLLNNALNDSKTANEDEKKD